MATATKNLHHVLRKLRVFHELTQREMCSILDFKQAYMSGVESGDKGITIDTLMLYGETFKIKASSILWMAEHYDSPSDKPEIPLSPKAAAIMKLLHEIKTSQKEERT